MRILSIDPGHTTGIAIVTDGKLELSMSVPSETLNRRKFFENLTRISSPDVVLVERIPENHADSLTSEVWLRFKTWYRVAGFRVVEIFPGQWKGMVDRQTVSATHQSDALTMAAWYLRTDPNDLLEE